jgi:hypothetical protein
MDPGQGCRRGQRRGEPHQSTRARGARAPPAPQIRPGAPPPGSCPPPRSPPPPSLPRRAPRPARAAVPGQHLPPAPRRRGAAHLQAAILRAAPLQPVQQPVQGGGAPALRAGCMHPPGRCELASLRAPAQSRPRSQLRSPAASLRAPPPRRRAHAPRRPATPAAQLKLQFPELMRQRGMQPPPRLTFQISNNKELLDRRREELEKWMWRLIARPEIARCALLKGFLDFDKALARAQQQRCARSAGRRAGRRRPGARPRQGGSAGARCARPGRPRRTSSLTTRARTPPRSPAGSRRPAWPPPPPRQARPPAAPRRCWRTSRSTSSCPPRARPSRPRSHPQRRATSTTRVARLPPSAWAAPAPCRATARCRPQSTAARTRARPRAAAGQTPRPRCAPRAPAAALPAPLALRHCPPPRRGPAPDSPARLARPAPRAAGAGGRHAPGPQA